MRTVFGVILALLVVMAVCIAVWSSTRKAQQCFIGHQAVSSHIPAPLIEPLSHHRSPENPSCWWTFDAYVPSKYEADWDAATTSADRTPCQRFSREDAAEINAYWKQYHEVSMCSSQNTCPPIVFANRTIPSDEKLKAPAKFSHFRYKKECGDSDGNRSIYWYAAATDPDTHEVPIEPLTGPLRHPNVCFDGNYLVNKDYLFYSDPRLIKQTPAPIRFLYFDAGASLWDSGAGGPSQSWFLTEFTNRWCIQNQGFWGWEAQGQNTEQVFNALPDCLVPVYHWYNIKVSPDPNDKNNWWRHLQMVARPEDFVVVKLDIDTPSVELPLIKQLLESSHLQILIDEMFFEYHTDYEPICGAWGTCGQAKNVGTYKDSLNLFSSLRRKGVRIHSWV